MIRSIPRTGICHMCHQPYDNFGHNPEPVARYTKRVCSQCNDLYVIPARLNKLVGNVEKLND